MISHIERIVKDQSDTISELKQQKMNYIEKLYNVNKRVTDLESRYGRIMCSFTMVTISILKMASNFQVADNASNNY